MCPRMLCVCMCLPIFKFGFRAIRRLNRNEKANKIAIQRALLDLKIIVAIFQVHFMTGVFVVVKSSVKFRIFDRKWINYRFVLVDCYPAVWINDSHIE